MAADQWVGHGHTVSILHGHLDIRQRIKRPVQIPFFRVYLQVHRRGPFHIAPAARYPKTVAPVGLHQYTETVRCQVVRMPRHSIKHPLCLVKVVLSKPAWARARQRYPDDTPCA